MNPVIKLFVFAFLCICLQIYVAADAGLDFYELLGISRDASDKEIRKAFKKLAVKMHPDKNKEDDNAEEKFIKLAKAYEVLKDPDTRKRYDLHGDTGDESSREYESYHYYANEFGLYDDDPNIITLTRGDFDLHITGSHEFWFVNFYSPRCSHCHTLAPIWRKLAKQLNGIIRIAAVNCGDEWGLCTQLQIRSYPSLMFYEKESHIYEAQKYVGSRTLADLQEFVLSKLTVSLPTINLDSWKSLSKENYLLFLCPEESTSCLEHDTQVKITAAVEGLVNVGLITDESLIKKIYKEYKDNPLVYWKANHSKKEDENRGSATPVEGSDAKELVDNFLSLLPLPQTIDEEEFRVYLWTNPFFKCWEDVSMVSYIDCPHDTMETTSKHLKNGWDIRSQLRLDSEKPWLLCFYLGHATDLDIQLRKLPALLSNMNIALVHCARSSVLCSSLHVSHYPSWGVIKNGGAFELHHGRDTIYDVVAFAKDSSKSSNLHALSPADFQKLRKEDEVWIIDWYAPWCPPCRKLMPEIRKVSQQFEPEQVQFGTIDCTLHKELCASNRIPAYPTVAMYNGSKVQFYHGVLDQENIATFVEDIINPLVINLDDSSFVRLMRKPKNELWVVDYFSPHCGACRILSPRWRALAKAVKEMDQIKIAQVNCEENPDLCAAQSIRAYPTIRLYPLGSKGLNTVALYNGNYEVATIKRWIIDFLPSSVEKLTADSFKKQILTKKFMLPWLIDFYTPWCPFCTDFEPEFNTVATKLEGKVRSGKIDCEVYRQLCGEMRIASYPTVKIFFSPTENVKLETYEAKPLAKLIKELIKSRKNNQHDEL